MVDLDARVAAKRQQILDAALTVFLKNGYVGASMDQVAAVARISKQTLYRQFRDKEDLFHEIIVDIGRQVDFPFLEIVRDVADSDDIESAIHVLASQLVTAIMAPRVQQIRRLVIAEAARFPDLGRTYWERGFERVLRILADCFERYHQRGMLKVANPTTAANHFVGLVLWIPSNRVMFFGRTDAVTAAELAVFANDGATAFLAAYGSVRSRRP